MKKKKWGGGILLAVGCLLAQLSLNGMEVHAEGTLYESPYVAFSPDGQAWTFQQTLPEGIVDGKPVFWYQEGEIISTGVLSTLRELNTGEHYYTFERQGEVPVGRWEVAHAHAQCIHGLPSYPDSYYGGIDFGTSICGKPYFSGWIPYCADCGEPVSKYLHYMSREAAASLKFIDVDLGYYYLCPSCEHLEQGIVGSAHSCKQISWNRYQVLYDANNGRYDVYGYTAPSFHMYNNETVFEGQQVAPNTHLTLNGFQLEGYHFVGWNTKADGSGTFYEDGAEILNLTTENYDEDAGTGIVTLYAQWQEIETNLVIDPNGGSYSGREETTVLRQKYGTIYTLKTETIIPPDGYTVTFETNGGEMIPAEKSVYTFEKWSLMQPAGGFLDKNIYLFRGQMDGTDTIKALYTHQPITLPTPEKDNSSFGGWYLDPECTEPVGTGGDPYLPNGDATLYAKWAELVLYAKDNYAANGGKGAADLSWVQADGKNKSYRLYQSLDGADFSLIYDAEEATLPNLSEQSYGYQGSARTFTVPYTGFYALTAAGAQGGELRDICRRKRRLRHGEILPGKRGSADSRRGRPGWL